uniref:ALA-interacting subunit n=1 Tax=Ananas comosus var. bracteatus TaxID=296719 RepID=A0A6V7QFF0_ANACO|nr:unnamed protein product [Ananas comosus var. bracteatus]
MKAPIYIYYELDNYYQNHRRYVKSRSDKQLRHGLEYKDTSSCKPEEKSNGLPIVPCEWNTNWRRKTQPESSVRGPHCVDARRCSSKFRKLYGVIEENLEANEVIEVRVANNYNTYSFGGKKKLVLTTSNWLGGKNNFLGIAYMATGSLCIVISILFALIHVKNPRPHGDPTYLSWNRKSNAS